jgi:predicted MPP superfamily phosphohydrolase
MQKNNRWITFFWDVWCLISLIGLWPRFIEPKLLKINHKSIKLPKNDFLYGLKILHFSDLHFHRTSSKRYLNKINNSIAAFKPDLILFTGDFLCHSSLESPENLKNFLFKLQAPLGIFACLGNHDYESYISRNHEGNYDKLNSFDTHFIAKSFKRLFSKKNNAPKITKEAYLVSFHNDLMDLLKETPVKILHNQTVQVNLKQGSLNITGLGDYWAGKCNPETAFKNFNPEYPGIILTHNPDSVKFLKTFPGHLILSGHTHGGQVNLPFIFKTFTGLENKKFKKGLFKIDNKQLFVTKGVGSHQKFRFFCPPELVVITLC